MLFFTKFKNLKVYLAGKTPLVFNGNELETDDPEEIKILKDHGFECIDKLEPEPTEPPKKVKKK